MDATLTNDLKTTLGNALAVAQDARSSPRVHLVGVAGSGMRALAEVLADWGWTVSGSDRNALDAKNLAAGRVQLFPGHSAEYLASETQLVIRSDAISDDNPEIRKAIALGIPVLSYFDMLGRISTIAHTLAIAGTHGKSTTTAMAAHILVQADRDPTVFCGATPLGQTSGGRAAQNAPRPFARDATTVTAGSSVIASPNLLLVEACEYRSNFLKLSPKHAAILNIEPDHFDCFDSLDALERAFHQFAASVPADGLLVVQHDGASIRRILAGLSCRIETFGFEPEADWSALPIEQNLGRFHFEIHHQGRPFAKIQLQTPGRHNILNALAATALAWANGVTIAQITTGLNTFSGLHRRLEVLGSWQGVTFVDDYAHHPTEVHAALAAVHEMFPGRRIWCVFQPHQASRTARLFNELSQSLQNTDKLLITDIFRAREGKPQPGEVTAADLARRAAELGVEVLTGHKTPEIRSILENHLVPGDVLVTLGAGDVGRLRPNGTWSV